MTDIPPGWYDDPEQPQQWRYWDGAVWTDHRSPKGPPPAPGSAGPGRGSVWQLIPDAFRLLGTYWRQLTVVALPVIGLSLLGIFAVYVGFDRALNVGVGDFLDRVTDPGFDPDNSTADDLWWDALDFDVAAGIGWWILGGLAFVAGGLANFGFTRFMVGAASGAAPTPAETYLGLLPRLLRLIGWALALFAVWVGATIVLVILAVLVPLTLIVTIPSLIVASIWSIPYLTLGLTVVVAGPRDAPTIPTAVGLVRGRWWAVLGRLLLIWIVVVAAGVPISIVAGPVFAVSVLGGSILNIFTQAAQTAVGAAGGAVLYLWAGGPVDPEMTAATPSEASAPLDRGA